MMASLFVLIDYLDACILKGYSGMLRVGALYSGNIHLQQRPCINILPATMNQPPASKCKTAATGQAISSKTLAVLFALMYLLVHVGFYPTYFKHLPSFEPFAALHHIHGFIMSGWLFLLILQPFLIAFKRIEWHRWIGKITYLYAPLVVFSLFQITRFSFNKWSPEVGDEQAIAGQALSFGQLVTFVTFYTLSVLFRKNTLLHVRFICATGLLMILPPVNRLLNSYTGIEFYQCVLISNLITIAVAFLFLIIDFRKKQNVIPSAGIFVWFCLLAILVECRETSVYQKFGLFIAKNLF